jgi:hypothetical protein
MLQRYYKNGTYANKNRKIMIYPPPKKKKIEKNKEKCAF